MTTQPEALRLADVLDHVELRPSDYKDVDKAAAELRRLHAENERLHRFELANNLWHEKTDWVQETAQPLELGRHRADVLKQRIERLHAANAELLEALKQHGAHHGNCDYMILLTSLPPMRKPCSCGLHAAIAKAEGGQT
jgi:hypothetical protein